MGAIIPSLKISTTSAVLRFDSVVGRKPATNFTLVLIHMYCFFFTPQPLRAVGVLFSPMVSRWAGGQGENVCPGCISETVSGRKLILGRNIG